MDSFFLVYVKWLKAVKSWQLKNIKLSIEEIKKNAVIKFPFVIMYIPN